MPQIKPGNDCGNSPKNLFLQNLTIAMASGNAQRISRFLTPDVVWQTAGGKPVSGVEQVCKTITRFGPATLLEIEHVITHGKAGAVNGIVQFGRKKRAFCHVYEFSSARGTAVKQITAYALTLD